MSTWYTPPDDQQAFRWLYRQDSKFRVCTSEPRAIFQANFSGYGIPYQSDETVAEVEDYYLHGKGRVFADGSKINDPKPEELPRLRDIGMPISGDDTAREQKIRCGSHHQLGTIRSIWEHLGLGPDGLPAKPAEPVQLDLFDLLGDQ